MSNNRHRGFFHICKQKYNMILYYHKKKVKEMRKAIKRGLIVALGVIIQILLSLKMKSLFWLIVDICTEL